MPEMDTKERLETTSQQGESTKAAQESHPTSESYRTFLTILPRELRDMVYGYVIGDHTIHIKSDVILRNSDSEDDSECNDDEEDEERPAELLAILSDDRGPLYHSLCDKELLHPKDARLYRIRSLSGNGSGDARVQSNTVIKDFKNVKCPKPLDPTLDYETIGSLEEEAKPAVQVQLAFLRANKQIYDEASTILYSKTTFGFDDPTTFRQFFSINYVRFAEPPTPINGTELLSTKRNSIRSVHIRARTALYLRQKILWMAALDAGTFVLPGLDNIRILFDLCHEGQGKYVDETFWQYWRHCNGYPLLKTAEINVATHFVPFCVGEDTEGEPVWEFCDTTWRLQLLDAILEHHMDVLFGVTVLDPALVAEREAIFARHCSYFS